MRPLKLTMQAFGAYLDKIEIPFENLGASNVYLISGDTGSGKTTIFDAICYALFDCPSGSTRNPQSLKSHFAKDDVEGYVELEFLFNGKIYKVSRTLPYYRKKARFEGFVLEPSKAQIILPDKRVIIKQKEVNEFIINLLGINAGQFCRIALLAQGEFLKLLNAPTEERCEIFRNIFKTDDFLLFQTKIKEKMLESKINLENIQKSILQDVSRIICESENLEIIKRQFLNDENFSNLDELLNLLDLTNKISIENIEKLKKEIEEKEKEREKNQKILEKIDAKADLDKENRILDKKIKTLSEDFQKAKDEFLKSSSDDKKIENLILEIQKTLENYNKSLEIKKIDSELEDKNKEKEKIENEIKNFEKKVHDIKRLHLGFIVFLRLKILSELDEEKKKFLFLKEEFSKMTLDYNKNYENYLLNQAGFLARELKDNVPCPVCGSLLHPDKAKIEGLEIVDKNALDKIKEELDRKNEELNTVSKNCSIKIEKIDLIEADYKRLSAFYGILESEIKENNKKIDFEAEIIKNENLIKQKNTSLNLLYAEIKSKCAQKKILEKGVDGNIDTILNYHTNLKKELFNLQEKQKKTKENYNSINIALNRLQSNKELILKQLKNYKNINILKIDEYNEKIEANIRDAKNLKEKLSNLSSNCAINTNLKSALDAGNNNYLEAQKTYLEYKTLSDCANGTMKGKKRITFEQFIQTYYLDIVLLEANKRLKIMSNSRFQLLRKKDDNSIQSKTGLDLEVMDYYTFRSRSTKTLSGGESFCAALSLALGLSTVAANLCGALNIDAMFIDEGFGSLDSDSLELAADVILNLSSNNRLVGIISHVESLKNIIPNKIITKKSMNGSSVILSF